MRSRPRRAPSPSVVSCSEWAKRELAGGVKVVSEWFPARERAFAIGLFNSGSTLGRSLRRRSWWASLRCGLAAAFLMTGAIGFAWLVLWVTTVRRRGTLRGRPASAGNAAPLARPAALTARCGRWSAAVC